MNFDDYLISKKSAAKRLGKSITCFDKYRKNNPDFPKAVKSGKYKQSPVHFSNLAVSEWLLKMQEES